MTTTPQASSDSVPSSKSRRGFGPFSGGQLTVIVVTLATLLLFPMGAWALSFTNVSIIDPGGANRAKVNSSGQVSASIVGSVDATPAAPQLSATKGWRGTFASDNLYQTVYTVPSNHAYVINSIDVSVKDKPGPNPLTVLVWATTNCDASSYSYAAVGNGLVGHLVFLAPGRQTITLPAGLTIAAGHRLCSTAFDGYVDGTNTLYYVANGYYVPPSKCLIIPTYCR